MCQMSSNVIDKAYSFINRSGTKGDVIFQLQVDKETKAACALLTPLNENQTKIKGCVKCCDLTFCKSQIFWELRTVIIHAWDTSIINIIFLNYYGKKS